MTRMLLPCPFCGGAMEDRGYGAIHLDGKGCPIGDHAINPEKWNNRDRIERDPVVKALQKLAVMAERQKAYHRAKQNEFPSIEQCVDEDGQFRPELNLYALLQGEVCNGRYSEADWWLCTIRAEVSALGERVEAPAEMLDYKRGMIGEILVLELDADEDSRAIEQAVEKIIALFASPPAPVVTEALSAAERALRPFYNAVFNDNGDMTVTGSYDYEEAIAGHSAYRKVEAALASRELAL